MSNHSNQALNPHLFNMDFHRLFDILSYQQAKYPQQVALAGRRRGEWRKYSTEKCLSHLEQLSTGLLREGLKKGDKAAIIAHCGSPVWNLIDLALQQIGVVVVPIHYTASSKDLTYIFNDAGISCCFVSNAELWEKVDQVTGGKMQCFAFEKTKSGRHTKELLAQPDTAEANRLQKLKGKHLRGRPRNHHLHLRYDRPAQRGYAFPPKHHLQHQGDHDPGTGGQHPQCPELPAHEPYF